MKNTSLIVGQNNSYNYFNKQLISKQRTANFPQGKVRVIQVGTHFTYRQI